jgi:outer membrane protein assembly factor BamD (BamD/ComL family)
MNDILEFESLFTKNENLNAAISAFALAELLEIQEKFDQAIVKFEEASKFAHGEDLEETSLLRIAVIHSHLLQFEKSISQYNYVLDNFPNSINSDFVYFQIGKNYYDLNKLEEAEQNFTKIIINYPKSIYYEDARKLIRIIRDKLKQS